MRIFFVLSLTAQLSFAHILETVPPGEGDIIKALAAGAAAGVTDKRDAHPKANGCFDNVTVTVSKNLESQYRLGLFANPGETFNAIVRSSNGANDPDQKGGAQGFALKVLLDNRPDLQKRLHEIKGEKFFSSVDKKYYLTQDFIGINRSRAFFVNDTADYGLFFAAQGAAGKAAAEAIKNGATPEQAAKIREGVFAKIFFLDKEGKLIRPREAAVLKLLGSIHTRNPLMEEYHSFVPSAFGDERAVKYMMAPCEAVNPDSYVFPNIPEIKPETDPAFLRQVLKFELRTHVACYKLYAQFHEEGFPSVEEGAGTWPLPAGEPVLRKGFVDLAEISIPQRRAGEELISEELCENLTFTPWHTLPEHLPIGGIQRAREAIYVAVANARHGNQGQKSP